jgi:hypothetical protein
MHLSSLGVHAIRATLKLTVSFVAHDCVGCSGES